MTPQEYIDKYYEELDQLEKTMQRKRQETRMKAFGSFQETLGGGSNRIQELEAEMEKEREMLFKLSQERSIYKESGAAMVKAMRDEQIENDQLLKTRNKEK